MSFYFNIASKSRTIALAHSTANESPPGSMILHLGIRHIMLAASCG